MIWIIAGPLVYIILTCIVRKTNVIDYVRDNKITLTLTTLVVLAIHVFGKTATAAVLMALIMPTLAAYSIPSLLAKAKEIWLRLINWIGSLTNTDPDGQ